MTSMKIARLLTALAIFSPGVPGAAVTLNLGAADSFAVLAGSTVTNASNTIIRGDIGVWPGSAITGFPPGLVAVGGVHAGNAVAMVAQASLAVAYSAAAGQACEVVLTGQDLGGLTLTPGVYCFGSSSQLTGVLTLDGQGDASAVFLFQMGSTLTTANASSVLLINGAQGENLFWQVGSSATLGTNTQFAGSILALASITLNTGASIDFGRALALTGAVTLDGNRVTAVAVPEPGTLSLLLPGLLLLFRGRSNRVRAFHRPRR